MTSLLRQSRSLIFALPICGIFIWAIACVEAEDEPSAGTSAGWVKCSKNRTATMEDKLTSARPRGKQ